MVWNFFLTFITFTVKLNLNPRRPICFINQLDLLILNLLFVSFMWSSLNHSQTNHVHYDHHRPPSFVKFTERYKPFTPLIKAKTEVRLWGVNRTHSETQTTVTGVEVRDGERGPVSLYQWPGSYLGTVGVRSVTSVHSYSRSRSKHNRLFRYKREDDLNLYLRSSGSLVDR